MTVFIITQKQEYYQLLPGLIDRKRFDVDEIVWASSGAQVQEAKSSMRGCILFWDWDLPEDPAALHRALHDSKRIHTFIFLVQEETLENLRKGMEIYAVDVLSGIPESSRMEMAVQKAADQLYDKRITALKLRTFRQMRFAMVGGAMRGMLMRSPNSVDLELLQELGMIPMGNKPSWLVMLHMVNRTAHPEMERTLISGAIGNITDEVFQPLNELYAAAWMGDDVWALFLQNREWKEPPRETIWENLQQIRKYLSQYLDWQMNVYITPLRRMAEAPGLWEELERFQKENVSLFPGVFFLEDRVAENVANEASGVQNLRRFLVEGYAELIEPESNRYLMQLMNNGHAGRKTLWGFYQEYLKLVYSVMWEKGWDAGELFRTEKELEILNNAPNTVTNMEAFLHHVSEYFRARYTERNTKTTVQVVCQYIADHYSEPLTREDLAEYIHLNPDYLTRIFRKETGCSLKDYILHKRMEAAQILLRSTNYRISEIAEMVGYPNFSYFTQNYRREFGLTPKQERNQNAKETVT